MSELKPEPVYFVDGCVIEHDFIYFAAKVKSVDPNEYDFSRMFYQDRENWIHHDLNWDVVSCCLLPERGEARRKYCALSMQGDVELDYPGGPDVEKIEGAGTYEGVGAVKQIKEIAGTLYVCGDQGQVYKRSAPGKWVHMDEGLLDTNISATALDLNGIDGTHEHDIYVVGYHGRIFHRNAAGWSELDSPTNLHLERVCCVSAEEVYICGNEGTLLKGNAEGFSVHRLDGFKEHFWDVEWFNGKLYIASLVGLFVFDGEEIVAVETGLEPDIGGYRLDARDGVLWSFGVDDLAFYDGKKWHRVAHPDNQ
ncbi:MAG: hypothetical protein JAY97_20090 [Candidatus Thiodiazotropha sp. 'RUGA']|nr:hypothetical protein [Candidatus Thiodiazotropha sp. 'RUGA']